MGVVGVAVRINRAYAELMGAGLIGPELARQQRHALVLVSLPGRLSLGLCCFDGAVSVGDLRVCLGSSCRCLHRPGW